MFSINEQKIIKLSKITSNALYRDPIFTDDKVFCLSWKELNVYQYILSKSNCFACKPIEHGLITLNNQKCQRGLWRLRSPGRIPNMYRDGILLSWDTTECVKDSIKSSNVSIVESTLIRPALWLLI